MKLIILLLFLLSTNLFAANVPVTVKATADNYFEIVLTQGQSHTMVYPASNIGWRTPKDTIIQIPNTNLNSCFVDFITWNAGDQRGLAATVRGNAGTLHTGNPAISVFTTGVRSRVGGPTNNEINQIYSTITPNQSYVFTNPGVWGAASALGFNPAVKWIHASFPYAPIPSIPYTLINVYVVYRFPCSSLVKPFFATPIPRPKPIPAPKPFPLPIGLKGDHFSCYMLDKGPALKPEQITITDQFGRAQAVLGKPIMLCNPSEKIHRGRNFKISNKKRHLVCYEILEQTPNKPYELEIENQFEKRKVRSLNRELFCVPSLKRHL